MAVDFFRFSGFAHGFFTLRDHPFRIFCDLVWLVASFRQPE